MSRPILLLLALLLAVAPVSARQTTGGALDWLPADVAAFIRLDLTDPATTLRGLNNAVAVGSFVQPERLTPREQRPYSYPDFFPLATFDTENITFDRLILPWLAGEVVVAFPALGDDLDPAAPLLILPANDGLQAANALSVVIRAQDNLTRDDDADATIFHGDRATFAFTPTAVLVGDESAVRAALATAYSDAPRLVDTPAVTAMRADIDAATAFLYLDGSLRFPALSVALNGDTTATGLLTVFGTALGEAGLSIAPLTASADAVGVSLVSQPITRTVRGSLLLHLPDQDITLSNEPPAAAVLASLPRQVMAAASGAAIDRAIDASLLALPLSGYARGMLGAFPLGLPSASSLPAPAQADLQYAAASFAAVLPDLAAFRATLSGSYAVALAPNPFDPTPLLNRPYDALLVAAVRDGDAALTSLSRLTALLLGFDAARWQTEATPDGDWLSLLTETDDAVIRLGVRDDILIAGTGDLALAAARALGGDNRLIDTPRWAALSAAGSPALYVDVNAAYALTPFALPGGPVSQGIGQLGARQSVSDGVYRLDVVVTVPAT